MYNEIIKKGYDYIKVIEDISNGAEPSLLFKVLDAISLEPNFHLGLRLAEEKAKYYAEMIDAAQRNMRRNHKP